MFTLLIFYPLTLPLESYSKLTKLETWNLKIK